MDLVNEQDLEFLDVAENGRQVLLVFDHRPRSSLKGDVQLVGNDGGEGGLAEAGRPVQQDVVQHFAAGLGGFNGDGEIVLHLLLANIFGEALRPQAVFIGLLVGQHASRDDPVFFL